MLRSSVKTAVSSLASLASAAPIEVITATFILVTLTYFQLLHAIKGSEFFQIPVTTAVPAKPVHLVRLAHPEVRGESPYLSPSTPSTGSTGYLNNFSNTNSWWPVSPSEFRKVLEQNGLEGGHFYDEKDGGSRIGEKTAVVLVKQMTLIREDGEESVDEWVHWLLHDAGIEVEGKRFTFQDLCFNCNAHFAPHPLHSSQSTLTLVLNPPTPDMPSLTYLHYLSRLPSFTSPSSNTTFRILPTSTSSWGPFLPSFDGAGLFSGVAEGNTQTEREDEDLLTGLRNVRWFAYAARGFVMRFVTLAKVS